MAFLNIKNRAESTLASGISDTDTSLTVASGEGDKFPTSNFHITIEDEILLCSSRSGDVFTVERAKEGTSAAAHSAGKAVELRITAQIIQDLMDRGFLSLADTPSDYSGSAGKVLKVNTGEDALEFDINAKDIIDYTDSPMIISGGDVTEGTNAGTFKVAALTALLRSTNSETGELVEVTKTEEDNISISAADTTYFVCLNYNGGTPTISLSETNPYDSDKRNIPIGKVMKDTSNNVHYISGGFRFQDGVRKLHTRARALRALELEQGSNIAYSGTNNFTMTAGTVYGGINPFSLSAYNSATTQFIPVYRDGGGGWTEGTPRNTIDYAHYDDGDGTLGDVGNNRYSTHWVYRHVDDGDVYVVYGRGSYTLAEAELEQEPTRPDHLTDFGCLIGKIIAPQSGGSFASVQMVTDTFFVGTNTSNHNHLGGLQGGTVGEYYHLTSDQHTIVTNNEHSITFVINGGGSVITTGVKGCLRIPFTCEIQRVSMGAPKESGSIVVDIWKDTHVNFPPTDADSITASAPPTISSAQKSEDTTLTGWTKTINAGDWLVFNVDSCTDITLVTLALKVKKT